jgi:hypothetical protein
MWVTHLIGLLRTHTAANSNPEAIVKSRHGPVVASGTTEHSLCGAARLAIRTTRLL